MARGGKIAWNTDDPAGMGALVVQYFASLRVKKYSELTIRAKNSPLHLFSIWLEAHGMTRPRDVTRPVLERYQRYLAHFRMADEKPLSIAAIHGRVRPLRAFFSWLAKNNFLLSNPAADLELPRLDRRLPRSVLSIAEAEMLLNQPDIKKPAGLRDRAIMETFYSTGIRRMELNNLKIHDADMNQGTVMIRLGKGRIDRLIPIGERALAWINKYLLEVRWSFAMEPDDGTLFLGQGGKPLGVKRLSEMVSAYAKSSGVKHGSCHMYRHTMATLMLEGGADVRYIQQMLGHARLETTSIYTHVSIQKLQEVHRKTHPGAALKRKKKDGQKKKPVAPGR